MFGWINRLLQDKQGFKINVKSTEQEIIKQNMCLSSCCMFIEWKNMPTFISLVDLDFSRLISSVKDRIAGKRISVEIHLAMRKVVKEPRHWRPKVFFSSFWRFGLSCSIPMTVVVGRVGKMAKFFLGWKEQMNCIAMFYFGGMRLSAKNIYEDAYLKKNYSHWPPWKSEEEL